MRLVSALALVLFAAFLAVSLPPALGGARDSVRQARRHAGESTLAQRERVWGVPYTQAVEEIRRAIPEDGVYAILNGDPVDRGAPIWVRFDLAPRRAVLLGTMAELGNARSVRSRIPRAARWVVVAYDGKPPELVEKPVFLHQLEKRE